jgi:hypothetical protein
VKVYAIGVLMVCLTGCNKASIDTKEAVRQGVIDYFAGRKDVNVGSMKVDVASVTFKENEADATVAVTAKGGGGQPMTFHYTLERKGSRWVVKPKSGGQGAHGAMPTGENPHGATPPGGAGGTVPPGHPDIPKQ